MGCGKGGGQSIQTWLVDSISTRLRAINPTSQPTTIVRPHSQRLGYPSKSPFFSMLLILHAKGWS